MSTSRKQQKLAAGIDGVEVEKNQCSLRRQNKSRPAPMRRVLGFGAKL
jgi:hypothetical protein